MHDTREAYMDLNRFSGLFRGFGTPVLTLMTVLFSTLPASAWDPLYYDNLSSVLPMMESDGDVALGFFSSSSRWVADSTGEMTEEEFGTALSVIRILASGRYGITSSHTVSILIPAYLQVSGEADTSGAGITDPWLCLDGWIERNPMVIGRLGIRIPLKGYLESGDYTESDPHFAFDGAVTVETPLSGPGVLLRATGGLRYSLAAWDADPTFPKDSCDTRPPIAFRTTDFIVFKANPELDIRIGGEFSTVGDVSADFGDGWETLEGTSVNAFDLRAGFDLGGESTSFTGDIYYRLSGENTNKEWGLAVTGLGLDFTDLFSTGGSGR
jgi:hypothetical protein